MAKSLFQNNNVILSEAKNLEGGQHKSEQNTAGTEILRYAQDDFWDKL